MSKFQNFWLNQIKIKSKASFVAWQTIGDKVSLKLIINGEEKILNLDGDFKGVTVETYAQLLKELE